MSSKSALSVHAVPARQRPRRERGPAQSGFTLIELMIVIAIVGILAALAVPAYMNYTIRAQVTEGLSLASSVRTAMAEWYAQNGTFPDPGVVATLGFAAQPAGQFATVDEIGNGVIQIVYNGTAVNANLAGQVLALRAGVTANDEIVWYCGTAPVASTLTIAPAANPTTIASSQWLPSSCQ